MIMISSYLKRNIFCWLWCNSTHINNEETFTDFDESFDLTKHFSELANGEKSNVGKERGTVIYLHSTDNRLV